MHTT
jgi:hypothetical protein